MSAESPAIVAGVMTAVLALVAASCDGSSDAGPGDVGVGHELLLRTSRSCHGDARDERVMRDAAAWQAWWAEATCGDGHPPDVDFSRQAVLAVRDVPRPNGCHGLRIASVVREGDGGLRVEVIRHVPVRGQVCTMQVVRPAHAVAIPRERGPVRFAWRTVQGAPPPAR